MSAMQKPSASSSEVAPTRMMRLTLVDERCCSLAGTGGWRLPTLRALIEGGANIKPQHPNGFTPIHKIAEFGSEDEMAYLIEQGCEVDSP